MSIEAAVGLWETVRGDSSTPRFLLGRSAAPEGGDGSVLILDLQGMWGYCAPDPSDDDLVSPWAIPLGTGSYLFTSGSLAPR